MTPLHARQIAEATLDHLLTDPELLSQMMQRTAMDGAALRGMIDDPAILPFVMDFVAEEDARILSLAQSLNLAPEQLAQAAMVLAGPGSHGWQD